MPPTGLSYHITVPKNNKIIYNRAMKELLSEYNWNFLSWIPQLRKKIKIDNLQQKHCSLQLSDIKTNAYRKWKRVEWMLQLMLLVADFDELSSHYTILEINIPDSWSFKSPISVSAVAFSWVTVSNCWRASDIWLVTLLHSDLTSSNWVCWKC